MVVLDSGYSVRGGQAELQADDGTANLLSFSQPGSVLDDVRARLEAMGVSVHVESGAPASTRPWRRSVSLRFTTSR